MVAVGVLALVAATLAAVAALRLSATLRRERARHNVAELAAVRGLLAADARADDAARRLAATETQFRVAFDAAPIGMALVAPDGRFLRVNCALCDMTGYADTELLDKTFDEITHPDDVEIVREPFNRAIAGQLRRFEVEKRCVRPDGSWIWSLATVAVVVDERGVAEHVIAQVQDITDRKRAERDLRYLADHDALTGLVNRRQLSADLARRLVEQRRVQHPFSVILVDLDHFKYVNDSYGHQVGDRVLRAAADALRARLRESDVVARLGGDEFACVLPETARDAAEELARELVAVMRTTTVDIGERELELRASVGVVCAQPSEYTDEDALLAAADLALYEAKEAGRDRYAVHTVQPGRTPSTAANWSHRIREALDQDGFVLHFQPIVEVASDRVAAFEALVRLRARDGGEPLLPEKFLLSAERYGLMPALDRWVVSCVVAELGAGRLGPSTQIAVNVSTRSIADGGLLPVVQELLSAHDVGPQRLCFEVSEAVTTARRDDVRRFAEAARAMGASFALDHVGGAFGSFTQVGRIPSDLMKLDGGFVRASVANRDDRAVLEALVHLARETGRRTVAQYVCDAETLAAVRELGIDLAQGFHIGRPLPADGVFGVRA